MILPPSTLGMLGGGQLGRFFVLAAHEMGYKVWVLDPDSHSPAGRAADHHLCADYDDYAALDALAKHCAAITTEFENVPADTLAYLAKFVPVHPSAEAVAVCQNRIAEKSFLHGNGLPHAPFAEIRSDNDIRNANTNLFPGILKVVRFGYDGKGQARVADRDAALAAFHAMGNEACVLEQQLELDYEISVVLARASDGSVRTFATAENAHSHGILDVSVTPMRGSERLRDEAQSLAEKIAAGLDYVGVLAVEFFIAQDRIFVNEMAPRPHNSGHYTIDACITNQFEQQVRVLCGLSLGDARSHSAAVMVNLLGDLWFENGDGNNTAREPRWETLLRVPNLKLHLYGKHHARPGRKMGHFTVIDADPAKAYDAAMTARQLIGIQNE